MTSSPDDARRAVYFLPGKASEHFLPYVAPPPGQLESAFQIGKAMFWMDGHGGRCRGYRIAPLSSHPDPSLDVPSNHASGELRVFTAQPAPANARWGQFIPLDANPEERHPTLPFLLVPEAPGVPLLLLGTPQWQGTALYKCRCERLFRVLRSAGEELHLLGRALPGDGEISVGGRRKLPAQSPDVEAYDPDQVERWFRTRESCETARTKAAELIRSDGRFAVKQGFHADFDPFN